MALNETVSTLASVATAISVVVAVFQLKQSIEQQKASFEDRFADQYRQIVSRLPVDALLGMRLDKSALAKAMGAFYQYIDLCNEQAFLASHGRIRRQTWMEWREGIEQNMSRPAFQEAWARIAAAVPDSFDDLRSVVPPSLPEGQGSLAEVPAATGHSPQVASPPVQPTHSGSI